MFSFMYILLTLNYCATIAHNTKVGGKRLCDRQFSDEYSAIDEQVLIRERRSQPLSSALFFTPYIEKGRIEEAIFDSRVDEPFSIYVSHAGFFTVNNKTNANLFTWFFPCITRNENASLVVWLESNLKYPSSSRVFDSTGPFTRSEGRIRKSEITLLENFHVLYIDTPIGSGFSFTEDPDGHSVTFEDAGKDVAEALKQFVKLFGEYVVNGVYLNGGDTFTSKIAIYSAWQLYQDKRIQIKGVMIGNGLLDPINMIGASDLLYQVGVADELARYSLQLKEEEIKRLLRSDQQWDAYEKYQDMVSEIRLLGYDQMDDFTRTSTDDSEDSKISYIFSRGKIKQALHVGQTSYNDIEGPMCYLQQDMFTSVAGIISNLIPYTKFLFYIGQYGIKVNAAKTYDFLRYLTWPGALAFHQIRFVNWCRADQIIGYQKSYGNLTYFVMRNTGNTNHMVDPRLMISLWKRLTGLDGLDDSDERLMIC